MADKNKDRKTKSKKELLVEEEAELAKKEFRRLKKSILAVFLLVFALVFALSLLGKAGVAGNYFDVFLGRCFGWGKYILPGLMILCALVYFKRLPPVRQTFFFVGVFVFYLFLLGTFSQFDELDKMKEMALAGTAGGYVGLAIGYPLLKYFGKLAGLVISIGFSAAGLILLTNITLDRWYDFFWRFFWGLYEGMKKLFSRKNENQETVATDKIEVKRDDNKELPVSENIKSFKFIGPEDEFENEILSADQSIDSNEIARSENVQRDGLEIKKSFFGGFFKKTGWKLPPPDILEKGETKNKPKNLDKNAQIIQDTLRNFGIEVEVGDFNVGPAVVQYTFRPSTGVKLSRIVALQNDLALALAAPAIRIEAPIPGKSLIGIEVPLPEKNKTTVRMRKAIESRQFKERSSNLTIILGEDVNGDFVVGRIDRMPHMMVAGATGTGKSVCINSILTSLLYQNSPEELKMILVDPKRVELSLYNGIPHLLSPVIVDNHKVINSLRWAVEEMERRYKLLAELGSRDIASYNEKIAKGKKREIFNEETGKYELEEMEKMPYIIIVIDELADLMAAHGKEVEGAIVRLAQMARAIGIHLIISTQRPSVDVLTGIIKANITTRVAFQVATNVDSRTILDMTGAEKLLGGGDMLFLSPNSGRSSKPKRVQGVFISEEEVHRVVDFIKNQGKNAWQSDSSKKLAESLNDEMKKELGGGGTNMVGNFGGNSASSDQSDPVFERAKQTILESNKASTSFLQRKLGIGYARAAKLMDSLEDAGIVGPAEGSKPRQILVNKEITQEDPVSDQQQRDKWE